ncbi:hypothetical protein ABZ063_44015, partial [Streptomyces sp. NPDC006333]
MRVLVVERHEELAGTRAAALCRERGAAYPAPYGPTASECAEGGGREAAEGGGREAAEGGGREAAEGG